MIEATEETRKVKEKNFTLEFKAGSVIDAQSLGELLSCLSALYSRIVWINGGDSNQKRFEIDLLADAPVWHQSKPIIKEIRKDFIDTIVTGIQGPLYGFDSDRAVQLYLFGEQPGFNDWPSNSGLNISSISFNSPLKMDLKGALFALIVLTCFGGGEFSIGGEDGIHVKMPGIGETIRTIYNTIFPREDQEFQEGLKSAMQRQATANTNMILELDKI